MAVQPHQPIALYHVGYQWTVWAYLAPGTTPLADFLKPEAWAHVARNLTPNDTILLKSEAGLFVAELSVAKVFVGGANVDLISKWERPAGAKVDPKSPLKVEFVPGGKQKWRIVNTETSEVLKSGFDTEGEAKAKLPEIEATLKG